MSSIKTLCSVWAWSFLSLLAASCSADPTLQQLKPSQEGERALSEQELDAEKIELRLSGLMAFAKVEGGGGSVESLDAMLIKTGEIPKVLGGNRPIGHHYPDHEAYIGWIGGDLEGSNLFGHEPYEVLMDCDIPVNLYKLSAVIGDCAGTTFDLQGEGLQATLNLDLLVDSADLRSCDNLDYFQIDEDLLEDNLSARLSIAGWDRVEAKKTDMQPPDGVYRKFGFRELRRQEGALFEWPIDADNNLCKKWEGGATRPFGDEVAAFGSSLRIGKTCLAKPTGEKMIVWVVNRPHGNYDCDEPEKSHHEGFHWFYNIAPSACQTGEAFERYPRPCQVNNSGGYPKCPQPLMVLPHEE